MGTSITVDTLSTWLRLPHPLWDQRAKCTALNRYRECFSSLQALTEQNPDFRFFFNNVALGDKTSTLPISFDPDHDSRNATLIPGHRAEREYEVAVRRLDDYIFSSIDQLERVTVIKIDVEGFEFPVLLGLERCFEKIHPLIVCEFKPWELAHLGYTAAVFEEYMLNHSYHAYDILDTQRRVDVKSICDLQVLLFKRESS